MYPHHYSDILAEIESKEQLDTHSSNKKLSRKKRKQIQRNNRKLKNAYFTNCVQNKIYNQTNFQADCDHVLDILGYY